MTNSYSDLYKNLISDNRDDSDTEFYSNVFSSQNNSSNDELSAVGQSFINRYENQHLLVYYHLKVICQNTPVKKGNRRFKKINDISQP